MKNVAADKLPPVSINAVFAVVSLMVSAYIGDRAELRQYLELSDAEFCFKIRDTCN